MVHLMLIDSGQYYIRLFDRNLQQENHPDYKFTYSRYDSRVVIDYRWAFITI